MKIFVKCLHCGYALYTDKKAILSLVLDNYVCKECQRSLNWVDILLCDRERGEWCNGCQQRFQCYSSEPIGKT